MNILLNIWKLCACVLSSVMNDTDLGDFFHCKFTIWIKKYKWSSFYPWIRVNWPRLLLTALRHPDSKPKSRHLSILLPIVTGECGLPNICAINRIVTFKNTQRQRIIRSIFTCIIHHMYLVAFHSHLRIENCLLFHLVHSIYSHESILLHGIVLVTIDNWDIVKIKWSTIQSTAEYKTFYTIHSLLHNNLSEECSTHGIGFIFLFLSFFYQYIRSYSGSIAHSLV